MKKTGYLLAVLLMLFVTVTCRDNNQDAANIETIRFAQTNISVPLNRVINVDVVTTPNEGKINDTVVYTATNSNVIRILEQSSNEGAVIEAIGSGSAVLTARTEGLGLTAFTNITVAGSAAAVVPHIVLPFNVIMIPLNETRNITVSLAGGTEADSANFTFQNIEDNIIEIDSVRNISVVRGKEIGETIIRVNHPKAVYPVDLLVYVVGINEVPVYISTEHNIIRMERTDDMRQFSVSLIGGPANEDNLFVYTVTQGQDVINLSGNGRTGTIVPKSDGVAIIEINHPRTRFPLQVQVVIQGEVEFNFIDVERSVIIINDERSRRLGVRFSGPLADDLEIDVTGAFSYEISDNKIARIEQSESIFIIYPLSTGRTVLTIKNSYADFNREVLIIVDLERDVFENNERYIWSSQNLITMQAQGDSTILRMILVGGSEADRNDFTWTVEDSSVIEITHTYGTLQEDYYSFNRRRNMASIPQGSFTAEILVKPLRTGMSRIMLSHPKSGNDLIVLVKVYPKNTFERAPVVLGGRSDIRVETGKSVSANLFILSGNAVHAENLAWEIEDESIISVESAGLNAVITGIGSGITRLRVTGESLRDPFDFIVLSGTEEELKSKVFIYSQNSFIRLGRGTEMRNRIHVSYPQGESLLREDEYINLRDLNIVNKNSDIVRVEYFSGDMLIRGLREGKAEISVKGSNTNELILAVNVEEDEFDPLMSFSLEMDNKIMGVVAGNETEARVTLKGAAAVQNNYIVWSSSNSDVARVTGSGAAARIRGMRTGITTVRISHPRSVNTYELLVYVVATASELQQKAVLHTEKQHYLMKPHEQVFIEVITNIDGERRKDINWAVNGIGIISAEISSSNTSALITSIESGSASIIISHPDQIAPLTIYFSIAEEIAGEKYIGLPNIIEGVAGNAFEIVAVTRGLTNEERNGISWEINGADFAALNSSRDTAQVIPRKEGQAVITVRQNSLGFTHNILLFIYETYEEMISSYVMGVQRSHINMTVGNITDVSLVFGTRGFPEESIPFIQWSAENNNVVSINGNGRRVTITALNTGIAKITASSSIANSVVIEAEVTEAQSGTDRFRISVRNEDRINNVVTGTRKDIEVRLMHGNRVINSGLSSLTYRIDDNAIASVTSVENVVSVTGLRRGYTYLNIEHPEAERERILINVGTQAELNASFPVFLQKSNYLLRINEKARINIVTLDNLLSETHKLSYESNMNNGVININVINKTEIEITGMRRGNDIVDIKFDGVMIQQIFISVTENENQSNLYMFTENIAGLIKGDKHQLRLSTNINESIHGSINWEIEDDDIAGFFNSSGNSAVIDENSLYSQGMGNTMFITGLNKGRTYINIRGGGIERKLLVVVVENQWELDRIEAINVENRYFTVNRGQRFNIDIRSYTGAVLGNTTYTDANTAGGNFNNIIGIENSTNSSVIIRGLNEGITNLRIRNTHYNREIVVTIEVRPEQLTGQINSSNNDSFLVTNRNLVIIHPDDEDIILDVMLQGRNASGSEFIWEGYDRSVINVRAAGSSAIVNPLREGETIISVFHSTTARPLKITVIVGERYSRIRGNEPYILAERDIFDVFVGGDSFIVNFELMNKNINEITDRRIEVEGASARVVLNNANISVTPSNTMAGLTKVTLIMDNLYQIFYILVRNRENTEFVYLTTNQNYIITDINSLRNIEVRLIGFLEPDHRNYVWTIDRPEIGQIIGNGPIAQIQALGYGDAIITVRHHMTSNNIPLRIHLRVTRNMALENMSYFTTRQNVIEMAANNTALNITIDQIGGSSIGQNIIWEVDNISVLDITSNGLQAQITAKRAGTARITVRSAGVARPLSIVVVAREPSNTGFYISSAQTLYIVEPGMGSNRIEVNLAGGDDSDQQNFRWDIHSQTNLSGNLMSNTITMVSSGNQANVTALNDGIARIRVAHEKADEALFITIHVSRFREMSFSVNQVTLLPGSSRFIKVNAPTYDSFTESIIYTSDNTQAATVIGTQQVMIVSVPPNATASNAIIRANIPSLNQSAELIVNVVPEYSLDTNRILTPRTNFPMQPRSTPERLNASLAGTSMSDLDYDNIEWYIDSADLQFLNVFPVPAAITGTGRSVVRGREIQVVPVPRNYLSNEYKSVVLQLRHPDVSEPFWQEILITIQEFQDVITLDKNIIEITNNRAEIVQATIQGARNQDYEDIVWTVSRHMTSNGSLVEVVRILGSGRSITLMPLRDGDVTLTAFYRGAMVTCQIIVKNDQMIQFEYQQIVIAPNAVTPTVVKYEVRPAGSYIQWFETGGFDDGSIIEYTVFNDRIEIFGLEPGTTRIVATANGRQAILIVNVRETYRVWFGNEGFVQNTIRHEPIRSNVTQEGAWNELRYRVYPPHSSIYITNNFDQNLDVVITAPNSNGEGVIRTRTRFEISDVLTFQQRIYNRRAQRFEDVGNTTYELYVRILYPNRRVEPFFVRNSGVWSHPWTAYPVNNNKSVVTPSSAKGPQTGNLGRAVSINISNNWPNNTYELIIGDGEDHYIIFEPPVGQDNMVINWDIEGFNTGSYKWDQDHANGGMPFSMKLERLNHNGVDQTVLRISGKHDRILYDRFAFLRDLNIHIESNSHNRMIQQRRPNIVRNERTLVRNFNAYPTVSERHENLFIIRTLAGTNGGESNLRTIINGTNESYTLREFTIKNVSTQNDSSYWNTNGLNVASNATFRWLYQITTNDTNNHVNIPTEFLPIGGNRLLNVIIPNSVTYIPVTGAIFRTEVTRNSSTYRRTTLNTGKIKVDEKGIIINPSDAYSNSSNGFMFNYTWEGPADLNRKNRTDIGWSSKSGSGDRAWYDETYTTSPYLQNYAYADTGNGADAFVATSFSLINLRRDEDYHLCESYAAMRNDQGTGSNFCALWFVNSGKDMDFSNGLGNFTGTGHRCAFEYTPIGSTQPVRGNGRREEKVLFRFPLNWSGQTNSFNDGNLNTNNLYNIYANKLTIDTFPPDSGKIYPDFHKYFNEEHEGSISIDDNEEDIRRRNQWFPRGTSRSNARRFMNIVGSDNNSDHTDGGGRLRFGNAEVYIWSEIGNFNTTVRDPGDERMFNHFPFSYAFDVGVHNARTINRNVGYEMSGNIRTTSTTSNNALMENKGWQRWPEVIVSWPSKNTNICLKVFGDTQNAGDWCECGDNQGAALNTTHRNHYEINVPYFNADGVREFVRFRVIFEIRHCHFMFTGLGSSPMEYSGPRVDNWNWFNR